MPARACDPAIAQLTVLFRAHPAWLAAARHLAPSATSSVHFTHRPGEVWRLEQREGETHLLKGAATDPDLIFRFTPGAIERLAALEGGIGDFAVELFSLITDDDSACHVDLRVAAGFGRLALRGYVRLLLAAGPRVLAFGARHGIRTLPALRRFVAALRARGPADWEQQAPQRRDPAPDPGSCP